MNTLTHGVVSHEVLLHLGLVPAVHGLQGTEQGPPPGLDLRGTHFHQLPDGCHHLRQRGWHSTEAGEFLGRGRYFSGLILRKEKSQNLGRLLPQTSE